MPTGVYSAAKQMGEHSGWSLSNLAMQKLLYIAHMFHLGEHDEPLVLGHFEAWDLGPVHPTLYHKLKIFGSSPVENIFRSVSSPKEETQIKLLDEAVDLLSDSPSKLVAITHWDGGAWFANYKPRRHGIVISSDDILKEYKNRQS